MLIFLDSSMLMIPLEKNINLNYEIESILDIPFKIMVPEIVLDELKALKEKPEQSIKRKAQLALQLAKRFDIIESSRKGDADTELIKLAEKYKAIIATNDRGLRKILRKNGYSVISLHGKNRLKLFGELNI